MGKSDRQKDATMLRKFIAVYCRKNHASPEGELCESCTELQNYALKKLDKCPHDPKPKCKDCKIHCYDKNHRQQIREVMKFSGIYFIKRGRVDWLIKYFF